MFLCISVRVCSDMSNYREKTSQRVAALYRSGHDIKWSEGQVGIYIPPSIDSLLVNASTLLPSIFQSESRLFGAVDRDWSPTPFHESCRTSERDVDDLSLNLWIE